MKLRHITWALPILLCFIYSCKSDRLVGTPEVSATEEIILIQEFTAPAPTYNDYTYTETTSHDGFGQVPDVRQNVNKVPMQGKWYAGTMKKTGEAINVFITSSESYNRGDTVTVSLREYNEGPCLVGPYTPPPVASGTEKKPVVPKGRADWQP